MRRWRWFWGGWVVVLLLGSAVTPSTHAQPAAPITYGQAVTGTINDADFHQLYGFNGRAGEIISLTVTVQSGDLDPMLLVLDPNSQIMAVNDDAAGWAAQIDSLRLNSSGSYFVVVTRFGQGQGSTSGDFTLLITQVGSDVSSGAVLRYGDEIFGEISAAVWYAIYFFEGQRGDSISIKMQRASENLDTYLILANANRQILIEQDDDPSAEGSAQITNFILPAGGLYIIMATRYGQEAGTTQGRYVLQLQITPESQRGFAIYDSILLEYGSAKSGAIDGTTPQRYYTFDGQRGDVITLELRRTAGNLDTLLILLDADRREVVRAESPRNAPQAVQIAHYSLPLDGRYYVMASRADFSAGRTEGAYTLSLEGRAGIGGTDFLEIFYGSSLTGTLDDARPFESYVFLGRANEVITLRMERIDGSLDPLLTLYFDGKQIAFADDSRDSQDAILQNFRLPADGVYRVEAARFDRRAGTTSGGYRLALERR